MEKKQTTKTDIKDFVAYWHLDFDDPTGGRSVRYAVPITDRVNNPELSCTTVKDPITGVWRLVHSSEPAMTLVAAELFPISPKFTATDATIEVTPVYPGVNRVLSLAYRIPDINGSETVATVGISGDPQWALTVKVKKKLSS